MNNVSAFAFDEEAATIDKARWLEAKQLIERGPESVRSWVACQVDGEYKDDMRRRLNFIKNSRKK